MIKVVAKNYIKADKVEEYITLARQLVKDTNDKDAGCIRYELFQDTSNPQTLTIIEEWEDMKALNEHMEAKHFKEIVPLFDELSQKPGEVNLYQLLA